MLAAMLDYPFASLVTSIEVLEGRKLKIGREIEGGNKEINEIDLPCVLSIQTGINEPRYVGMRGIRQVASRAHSDAGRIGLGLERTLSGEAAAKVKRLDYFVPAGGQRRGDAGRQPGGSHRQTDGVGEGQRRVELMPRIFAYIVHKSGVADDTAAELPAAARKIDPTQPLHGDRHRVGRRSGHGLRESARHVREIWKIAREPLAYPNAELVRKALVSVLPRGQHPAGSACPFRRGSLAGAFGQDECGVRAGRGGYRRRRRRRGSKLVRQEFGGQVSTHVRCDISIGRGAEYPPGRIPGRRKARRPAGRSWISRRRRATLTARRRYLETIAAETGDVDITKQPVLVSIGRGIQEQENVAIAEDLAEAHGRGGELLAAGGGCQVDGQVAAGGVVRPDGAGRRSTWRAASADRSSTWRASRAVRSSWRSTRTRKRRSSAWRTWESWTTSWSSCRRWRPGPRRKCVPAKRGSGHDYQEDTEAEREIAQGLRQEAAARPGTDRRWTRATSARSRSSGTCAVRTSWGFSSCSFPRSTAASAAARSTCTASARRWRGSTWGSPPRCWRPFWAATRSPSGATPEQKKLWLSRIAEEGLLFAYGATEPDAGSDLGALQTTAERVMKDGRDRRVPHQRQQAVDQQRRHRRTPTRCWRIRPAGPSWFIVEKGAPGFTHDKPEDKHGIRTSNTAALSFSDVYVDADRLIGGVEGQGLIQAQAVFGYTRLMVAAFGLGGGWAALDRAIPYSAKRIQAGVAAVGEAGLHAQADRAATWRAWRPAAHTSRRPRSASMPARAA